MQIDNDSSISLYIHFTDNTNLISSNGACLVRYLNNNMEEITYYNAGAVSRAPWYITGAKYIRVVFDENKGNFDNFKNKTIENIILTYSKYSNIKTNYIPNDNDSIKHITIVPYQKTDKFDFEYTRTGTTTTVKAIIPKNVGFMYDNNRLFYLNEDTEYTTTFENTSTTTFSLYFNSISKEFVWFITYSGIISDKIILKNYFFVTTVYFYIGISKGKYITNIHYLCKYDYAKEDAISEIYENIDNTDDTVENIDILSLNKDKEIYIINSARKYCNWSDRDSIQNLLTLAIFTDIHGDEANLKNYLKFCNYYNSYIDDKLCLGDMVNNLFIHDITYWDNIDEAKYILRTIGNHDTWIKDANGALVSTNKEDVYNKFFKNKFENFGNIVQPSNAEETFCMSYYKDYTAQKVRLIILDCMYFDSDQYNWLDSVLKDALANELHVAICTHYNITKQLEPIPNNNFYSLDYAYNNLVVKSNYNSCINLVDNYINDGGKFITWFSGDSHYDACGIYTSANTGNKQLNLTFENASANSIWNDSNRIANTKTQDSFNIVSIDTYSNLIKVVRIGNDCDRYLRDKKYFSYNYLTHQVMN